jgi:hypothetical protein
VEPRKEQAHSEGWVNFGLGDQGSILDGGVNFSVRHRVQTGSEAHSSSYPMGNGGTFPGGKAAGG